MKIRIIALGALAGGLLTAALTAVLYLANQLLNLPFVPFDLFNWVTRVLPGDLVTFGIDTMINIMLFLGVNVAESAKTAERISAVLQFMALGILVGALYFAVMSWRRSNGDRFAGLLVGALFGLPLAAISLAITQSDVFPVLSLAWIIAAFLIWGLALNEAYAHLVRIPEPEDEETRLVLRRDRRRFLIQLGAGTALITIAGAGLGTVLKRLEDRRTLAESTDEMVHNSEPGAESPFPNAGDPVVPVPGTRPEYTPVKDHYKVFIQTEPTLIDEASWVLPITGLVDNPQMLTLEDFKTRWDSIDQYVTLSCISGRIGTSLISTTQWTGVSAQDVLADLGLQEGAQYLVITSGDGFYETVDIDLIMSEPRIMFCYAWDGNDLPKDHGFPLRIWIPDRYGMKQPKWITEIEVTAEYQEGYWVERNWDEVAQVKTTSVIDTVAVDHLIEDGDQRRVPIGGIAFSGARGISAVQVRVDGGEWQDAQLRSPLSETTWVIWRYEWPFEEGQHLFEVRCRELDGTPQIEEQTDNRPSGATGIDSVEATIMG
ncbi:MAG: molybdopterin-dependent oxidoreductase [Candidatus Promineifilaceae bacterium]|jgi:DMSO/TMAO reductase YedYZ molybdopterin-dependent catalytic subunit